MSSMPRDRSQPLADAIRGHAVAYVGRLGRICHEEFVELVEGHGGRVAEDDAAASLVVVGEHESMLAAAGQPAACDRGGGGGGGPALIAEREFLERLGVANEATHYPRLYSAPALCELLGIDPNRLRAWTRAGLIVPVLVEHGVGHFDFRQVATAQQLSEATRAGVRLADVRKGLERMRAWMPDAERAIEQLAVVERSGPMLVRLEDGELADPGGQFHFDFTGEPEPGPASLLMPGVPSTAEDWFAQGVVQEEHGQLAAAEQSYRQALLIGGPQAQACYNLANVLAAAGKAPQALERYRQTVEVDPDHADAWNNLALLLAAQGRRDEACYALRQAVGADADHAQAHFNLADLLDELGRGPEAREHWAAHARLDPFGEWGRYARQRLGRDA